MGTNTTGTMISHPVCGGKTCKTCLTHQSCVWMRDGTCSNRCNNFPNINCYSPDMFGSSRTNRHEICQVEQFLHHDNERCYRQKTERICEEEIGCVWLGTVLPSGKREFWCALHLESTNTTNLHRYTHHTYPPYNSAAEAAAAAHNMQQYQQAGQVIHEENSSIYLKILEAYALLPFVWWVCWLAVNFVKRIYARRQNTMELDSSIPMNII